MSNNYYKAKALEYLVKYDNIPKNKISLKRTYYGLMLNIYIRLAIRKARKHGKENNTKT